jgi:hypothetical protein
MGALMEFLISVMLIALKAALLIAPIKALMAVLISVLVMLLLYVFHLLGFMKILVLQ